jgi:hypothetical protein
MAMAAAPTARPNTNPLLLAAVERCDVDSNATAMIGAAVGVVRIDVAAEFGAVERS